MIEVETKTLSTIIGIHFFGNSFFKILVVIQKDAFVFLASTLYFLEWKKVISFNFEFCKSLISVIFRFLFFSSASRFSLSKISENLKGPLFLKKGYVCEVMFHADKEEALSCDLPNYIEAEVTYTEPGIKGDTATNTLKPATIETGAEVKVPLFINMGDRIKVDTRTGVYSERAK